MDQVSALAGNPAFIDALARRMGINVEQVQALASRQTAAGFTLAGSDSHVRDGCWLASFEKKWICRCIRMPSLIFHPCTVCC
jgi:hypothetical protein